MNPAYKHLESKLRIAELTIGQWALICLGVALGAAWAFYLSPFGVYATVFVAAYLGGLPALAALVAGSTEFDFWLVVRSAARFHRDRARYLPGPGPRPSGYVIDPDPRELRAAARAQTKRLELEELWDS